MRRNAEWISCKHISSILLILLTLTISVIGASLRVLPASSLGEPTAVVRFIPGTLEFDSAGEEFVVALVCENAGNLSGLDVQMSWDPDYLEYINHTVTATVEDYPDPIPPSPYAGIMHDPPLPLVDEVNATAGTCWFAFAHLGLHSFNGSGTFFIMAFRVIDQPSEGEPDAVVDLQLTNVDLARSTQAGGSALDVDARDGQVTILAIPFIYPDWPLLKVTPETITDVGLGDSFTVSVEIMGDNGTDLDAFWDIAGITAYLNFNTTLLQATSVTVDPDGWFAGFWDTVLTLAEEIDNTAGIVDVSFVGYGENHTAPSGRGTLFNVTFQAIFESEASTPPSEMIYLQNPTVYTEAIRFYAQDGLVNTASPTGTVWDGLFGDRPPAIGVGPYELLSWTDDGDGILNSGDQILLNDTVTGFYFDYHLDELGGSLNLSQQPFQSVDDHVWAASLDDDALGYVGYPGRYVGTEDPYNDFGAPNWIGNFSLNYPFVSVDQINVTALPFTPDNYTYTLTEGVDYLVHTDDDLIELLTPVDVQIINECWVDGVNNTLNGWPTVGHMATAFESVFVDMHNGTARPSPNAGYRGDYTFGEWWYDPPYPNELQGWDALEAGGAPYQWLANSTWWINYTAASYLTIDYSAEPAPAPIYVKYNGSYGDFLALGDPIGTGWNETYPQEWRRYTVTGWTDGDTSGNITVADYIDTVSEEGNRTFLVNKVTTDAALMRKSWVCNRDVNDPFFGVKPIVGLAGIEHPERAMCPWHYKDSAARLPHKVEDAVYTASLSLQPPVANFTYQPAEPRENDLISFDASGSYDLDGTITTYEWDFGDGANDTGAATQHAYTTKGEYNVTLTVTDNSSLTGMQLQTILVKEALALTLSPDTGYAATTITGTGFDPNSAVTITWDDLPIPTLPANVITDDEGRFTAMITIPTPDEPGTHTIKATDESNNTVTTTFTVIDMTGPAGATGPAGSDGSAGATGPEGEQGPAGPAELLYGALILAIIALVAAIYAIFVKK